jgi:hypothetical protein
MLNMLVIQPLVLTHRLRSLEAMEAKFDPISMANVHIRMLIFVNAILILISNYMSNRKNPGNTKYVFDGHWFMEIYGNC